MKNYIGCKMVEAEPCFRVIQRTGDGYTAKTKLIKAEELASHYDGVEEGYKVRYEDGYESFSPKDVFEKAYMMVSDDNTITKQNVDDFIKSVECTTIGEKTTLVRVTLVNGFELVEASSCVDAKNYDKKIGAKICMKKIKNKIWLLLGFFLQTAIGGVKP